MERRKQPKEQKENKMGRKSKKMALYVAFLLFFSVFILISNSSMESYLRHEKRINILLMGCDEIKYSKHSDVIMLLSYEPKTKFLDVLSVPRDTKVMTGGGDTRYHWHKINEIYAEGFHPNKNPHEGSIALKDIISKILNIDIPFYFQLDYNSFRDVINVIGGVEIDIEKNMDYDDNWGNLHIHFKPGRQKLSGQKALEYIRFRDKVLGDVGRIARQHRFMNALSNQIKSPVTVLRIPGIVKAIRDNSWTNMSLQDMLAFIFELRDMTQRDLRVQNLPGTAEFTRTGKSFWILEKEKTDDIVQVINNSYRENMKSYRLSSAPEVFKDIVVVEVWNASGREGLAKTAQLYLRHFGIDAVRWGNYGSPKKYTMVIDRQGNSELAYKVAKVVGCNEVKTEIDKTRLVDLSIVIGEDYKEVYEEN